MSSILRPFSDYRLNSVCFPVTMQCSTGLEHTVSPKYRKLTMINAERKAPMVKSMKLALQITL